MTLTYPKRLHLAHLPTPVEEMNRLSQHLKGPKLFIKRDDQTGLALGGNKTRKLEFLAADAIQKGCDHLVTTGAPQSNHCRQTAAAAARLELGCTLILKGSPPPTLNSNLLLDKLLGADLFWAEDRSPNEVLQEVTQSLRNQGRRPYPIGLGGSNVLGATAYVLAMEELMSQLTVDKGEIDYIIFASSSGGTQAGIVLGAQLFGFKGGLLGISIEWPQAKLKAQVAALSIATAMHLNLAEPPPKNLFEFNDNYLGRGYAILGRPEQEAIRLVAELEGILLDPVYTGRAMAGLIDLIRQGTFSQDQKVLFWHTGGTPALFAYAEELLT